MLCLFAKQEGPWSLAAVAVCKADIARKFVYMRLLRDGVGSHSSRLLVGQGCLRLGSLESVLGLESPVVSKDWSCTMKSLQSRLLFSMAHSPTATTYSGIVYVAK